jgi:hypothetical protein
MQELLAALWFEAWWQKGFVEAPDANRWTREKFIRAFGYVPYLPGIAQGV